MGESQKEKKQSECAQNQQKRRMIKEGSERRLEIWSCTLGHAYKLHYVCHESCLGCGFNSSFSGGYTKPGICSLSNALCGQSALSWLCAEGSLNRQSRRGAEENKTRRKTATGGKGDGYIERKKLEKWWRGFVLVILILDKYGNCYVCIWVTKEQMIDE